MSAMPTVASRGALVLSLGALGLGCSRPPPPPSDEAVAARAREAIAPFKASLRQALGAALARSVEEAIDVCAEKAPALARDAAAPGVVVGRSSKRLRNPDNAPRPWLAPLLDELSRAPAGEPTSRVVALADGRHGYVEPIWTGPECLVCHGEALSPSVAARIDARYPDDRARGFRPGELRGVFWAEVGPEAFGRR